jgi:hypothetical protein
MAGQRPRGGIVPSGRTAENPARRRPDAGAPSGSGRQEVSVGNARPSFMKRQKELKRQEKAKDKETRRDERKKEKADRTPGSPDEDPDIAHIVPGPQPVSE